MISLSIIVVITCELARANQPATTYVAYIFITLFFFFNFFKVTHLNRYRAKVTIYFRQII